MTGPLRLRKVRSEEAVEGSEFRLHLFRGGAGRVCGWYIGPVGLRAGRLDMPYLPASRETPAPLAVVRAIREAGEAGSTVCVVDPDDLWDPAWRGER